MRLTCAYTCSAQCLLGREAIADPGRICGLCWTDSFMYTYSCVVSSLFYWGVSVFMGWSAVIRFCWDYCCYVMLF